MNVYEAYLKVKQEGKVVRADIKGSIEFYIPLTIQPVGIKKIVRYEKEEAADSKNLPEGWDDLANYEYSFRINEDGFAYGTFTETTIEEAFKEMQEEWKSKHKT